MKLLFFLICILFFIGCTEEEWNDLICNDKDNPLALKVICWFQFSGTTHEKEHRYTIDSSHCPGAGSYYDSILEKCLSCGENALFNTVQGKCRCVSGYIYEVNKQECVSKDTGLTDKEKQFNSCWGIVDDYDRKACVHKTVKSRSGCESLKQPETPLDYWRCLHDFAATTNDCQAISKKDRYNLLYDSCITQTATSRKDCDTLEESKWKTACDNRFPREVQNAGGSIGHNAWETN